MADVSETGAHCLVDTLTQLGVDVVFGLPGVHNLAVWEALRDSPIRVVGVRHEQAAGYAADGYFRATGRLGVALVTTGPGTANTVAAAGEARASGAGVLIIATDIPSTLRKPGVVRGVLHECGDQQALLAPVTKAGFTAGSADDIAPLVQRAARLALAPQSGPVYVGIPTDFLRAPAVSRPPFEPTEMIPTVDVLALDRARELLSRAQRPLVWAGGGALRSNAGAAVGMLAERLAAPIVTTFAARGLVPPDHPCLAPNPVHDPEVGALWDEADLVVAIGSDLDGLMTQNWAMPQPPALIAVNVDADDAAKNYTPDLTLVGDAGDVTDALTAGLTQRPGLERLTARLDDMEIRVRKRMRKDEPHAAEFLSALSETLPESAVLVCDMCVAGYWVGGFHRIAAPRRLAYPMGWGTLGFGFPAALGAASAGLGRAVCIAGDGGFLYGAGELATAVQEGLPVTVVIIDDGGYGMLRHDQTRAEVPHFGVDLVSPDFVGLARAFGVHADRVEGFGRAFRRLLREFTRADEPNVLVVGAALRPPLNTSPRWYRHAAGRRSRKAAEAVERERR